MAAPAKRPRLAEAFAVGDRVVYTPARGSPLLATVRCVSELEGKRVVGLEADEVVPGWHDGRHSTGRFFSCQEGRGFYVQVSCGGLRKVDANLGVAQVQRLLQGLEAKSEKDALHLSRLQRQAETALRAELGQRRGGAGEAEGDSQADSQLPATNGEWAWLRSFFQEGRMTRADAEHLFERVATSFAKPLPATLLLALAAKAKALVLKEPSLLRLATPAQGRLAVLGDTHGHLKDLVHIWKQEGFPSRDLVYLFNGDICDRGDSAKRGGQQALHIWACVLSFKIAEPESIYINRGNHEDRDYWPMYGPQGFAGEIESKYSREEAGELMDAFGDLCDALPLGAVVDDCSLVLHGGLPRCDALKLEEIAALPRPVVIPETPGSRKEEIIYDITWADPHLEPGFHPSDRGGEAVCFGPDITQRILQAAGLRLLVRSHELPGRKAAFKGRGYEWWHPIGADKDSAGAQPPATLGASQEGWCLTVFSASDYCGCVDGNQASRMIFTGGGHFHLVEHHGWQAERTLLAPHAEPSPEPPPHDPAELSLFEGALERSLIEAIVERKHDLLAEFVAMDKQKDWFLLVDVWLNCCRRVLPEIPWEDLLDEPRFVPMNSGHVNYMLFLTRYQVRFSHKQGLHASFHRRLASQLFEGLLLADRPLRETLALLDPDGDGVVSVNEFAGTLARFGKVLLPSQAKALYRTTADQGGTVRVETFLATLSLHFALTHPTPTTPENAFVPKLLDAICRDILSLAQAEEGSQGVAVVLRRFFERADQSGNSNGYLELAELLSALRQLPSCKSLGEVELEAIGNYVDLNGDKRINYAELLRALSVRRCDTEPGRRGPKALLEDMLEAVHRVLHFEFAKPLRSLLRRLCPRGCTRCTPGIFRQALCSLNGQESPRLSEAQLRCLIKSIDVELDGDEEEPRFDFEEYLDSFSIVDTLEDPEVVPETDVS